MWPFKKKTVLSDIKEVDLLQIVKFKDGKYGVRINPQCTPDGVSHYYSVTDKDWFGSTHQVALYCKMTLVEAKKIYKLLSETVDVEVVENT